MRAILPAACFALVAPPAIAQTLTIKESGVPKYTCQYSGAVLTPGSALEVDCVTPVRPFGTPTIPDDSCIGVPVPPDLERRTTLGPSNAALVHYGTVGRIYSYPLPRKTGATSGSLVQGDHPGSPSNLRIEWAISRCPGDMLYYTTSEAALFAGRGGIARPCGAVGTPAPGFTLSWSATGSFYECKVDGFTWYLNVRYLENCPAGATCPAAFWHSEF